MTDGQHPAREAATRRTEEVRAEVARLSARLTAARQAVARIPDYLEADGLRPTPDARPASTAGSRLDDPDTLEALGELAAPCARRLAVLSTIVDDLAAGRLNDTAALEGLRHLASTQPIRGPR